MLKQEERESTITYASALKNYENNKKNRKSTFRRVRATYRSLNENKLPRVNDDTSRCVY